MSSQPYIVETAVFLLLAFVLGGLVGFYARRWLAPPPAVGSESEPVAAVAQPVSEPVPEPQPVPEPESAPVPEPAPEPEPEPVPEPTDVEEPGKPVLLTGAREGAADDLKKIKGVGPKLEATLNTLGVYHYDQIAAWDDAAIAWVDDKLSFRGRIQREDWVAQAKELAKG